jgi:photosystem II stability/assembly factor-like uncharacterized protein
MKKVLFLLALLATLQLLVGDVNGNWQDCFSTFVQYQMIRQSSGMIYGVGGRYFIVSTDGINYQNILVADCDSLYLESAYMVSSTVGYCGGYVYRPSDPFLSRPVLYKTINGGQSWTRTGQFEQQTAYYVVSNVQFITEQEGYVALNPLFNFDGLKIYRTTNGGQNWNLVYGPTSGNCVTSDFSPGFMVIGKTSPAGALVSTDGVNWQFRQNGLSSYPRSAIVSDGRLVLMSQLDFLYSDDLGNNWIISDQSQLTDDWTPGGCFTDCRLSGQGSNLYAVTGIWDGNSSHPGIVRSLDNGTSWQWVIQPADMPDQSGQTYGICYWGEYVYIAHNLHIYRMHVGPVANDDPTVPAASETITCYPNPFRGSTNITIKQIDNSLTTVAIYNLRGQLIRTVVNNLKLSPGEHSFTWDGRTNSGQAAAAGIYFFKMISGKYSATRKMLLLR